MTEVEQIDLLERLGLPSMYSDEVPADPTAILQQLFRALQPLDSFGVPGSEFATCECCGAGDSPSRPYVHTPECPVGRAEHDLERYWDHLGASFEFADGAGV